MKPRPCLLSVALLVTPAASLAISAPSSTVDASNAPRHRHSNVSNGQCSVCHLNLDSAPALYALIRRDGLGCVVFSIILEMAWAAHLGLNFGGVYDTVGPRGKNHGVDIPSATMAFFSLEDKEEVFVPDITKIYDRPGTVRVSHASDLEFSVKIAGRGATQFIVGQAISARVAGETTPLTPRFLGALRGQVQPFLDARLAKRSFFRRGPGSGPQVALHLRRGDILKKKSPDWWTPNEWYYDIVGHIRAVVPDASIHLFSESFSAAEDRQFDGFTDLRQQADDLNDKFYMGFKRLNLPIHLNDDVLDVWAHFASADIFVTAKSSFSEVPALVNRNCVIFNNYEQNPRPPLEEWLVVGTDARAESLRGRLKGCMRQRLPEYKLAD